MAAISNDRIATVIRQLRSYGHNSQADLIGIIITYIGLRSIKENDIFNFIADIRNQIIKIQAEEHEQTSFDC